MTGKLTVETFVTAGEVVGLAEAWYLSFGSMPKDSTEVSGEKDSFDGAECNALLSKARVFGVAPLQGPFCFLLDTWQGVKGVE
jgi:hypothetical protein